MMWLLNEVTSFSSGAGAKESEAEESAPMSGREPPATTETTLVMEVDEDVERDFSSRMLDDLSARLLQERPETVEEAHACASGNEKEKDYTICFGVFLRDLRMQRVYLDGYARLHRNHVYLGLVLFPVLLVLVIMHQAVGGIALERWCSLSGLPWDLWICRIYGSAESMNKNFWIVDPDNWKYSFSVLFGFVVLGGVTNWLLHSRFCMKVKEKSWAMLAVFLSPYVGYNIYAMWWILAKTGMDANMMWYVSHSHTHLDDFA